MQDSSAQSSSASLSTNELQAELEQFNQLFSDIKSEISKVIVGNDEIINGVLTAFFAGGHCLLEGAPGLGKTRLVHTVAEVLGLKFKRIQFTPDLMPADVTGTQLLTEDDSGSRKFVFAPGPIFANIVLADEINRATPKTQSSLLEAMEETQVSIFGETHKLPEPFFVLATQNPIELEGTYPLPEAQLDRFLLKLHLEQPSSEDLQEILRRTTGVEEQEIKCVIPEPLLLEKMKHLVRRVQVADSVQQGLVHIVSALMPDTKYSSNKTSSYVRYGPGPRGAQAVILGAKVWALRDGRLNLSFEDIKNSILPALRHRLVLNFQAEADQVIADDIISEVLSVL